MNHFPGNPGDHENEKRSLRPYFNAASYMLGAEIQKDFRKFTLDRKLLMKHAADALIDNPDAIKNPLAPKKIWKREILKEDLLAVLPKDLDEISIEELMGESEEMNSLLLELGAATIRQENGVIVVVNTQSPKSIGLDRVSLDRNGLYIAKFTGLRENPDEYEKAR